MSTRLPPDNIHMTVNSTTQNVAQDFVFTCQLRSGTINAAWGGILINLVRNGPGTFIASGTTGINGATAIRVPASTFGPGSLSVISYLDSSPLTRSNVISLTITGSAGSSYDGIRFSVADSSQFINENFLFTVQLMNGSQPAQAGGVRINIADGSKQLVTVTTLANGSSQFRLAATQFGVGTFTLTAYLDSAPTVFDNVSITVAQSPIPTPVVGAITLAISNPNITNLTEPFILTGTVRDQNNNPMSGAKIDMGTSGGVGNPFVFNLAFAYSDPQGNFSGNQLTTSGNYSFKAVSGGVESNIVTGARTDTTGGIPTIVITRKADNTIVDNTNNVVALNSVITVSLSNYTANSTTGVRLFNGDLFVQNVPTSGTGTAQVDYQLPVLGITVIGVKDLTKSLEATQVIDVQDIGPPPPPPPPGGGTGKTFGEMSFTEKIFLGAVTAMGLPIALKMAGIDRIIHSRPAEHRVHRKRVNRKALSHYLRRIIR